MYNICIYVLYYVLCVPTLVRDSPIPPARHFAPASDKTLPPFFQMRLMRLIPNTIYNLSIYFISKLITPISTTSHLLRSTTYSFVQKWKERSNLVHRIPVEVNLPHGFLFSPADPENARELGWTENRYTASHMARYDDERDLETRGQRVYEAVPVMN